MTDYHSYVLWAITTPLTDDTIEDGIVTEEGTKTLAKNALLELGRQYSPNPCHVTHLRPSIDGQKYIVELCTPVVPTATLFYNKLAELLPYTAEQIAGVSNFTVSPGDNWEERRKATVDYLINNKEEWEEV